MINNNNNNKILLEIGTNEMELMEFKIGDRSFGINVAKVLEIILSQPVTPMPNSHPAIEGVFKPRDNVLTVVDLPKYLGINVEHNPEKDLFIIADFNQIFTAFRVHSVVGINRISWEAIQKPDKIAYGGKDGVITGITNFSGRLITILDFEKITADIAPETTIKLEDVDDFITAQVHDELIVMAEDSSLLSELIFGCLHKAGYQNILRFNNGREAWEYLQRNNETKSAVKLVITDIEMPEMDGHRLTKLIKEDSRLKHIPVVIFSSLINESMRKKGEQLGADIQLSKPEIGKLVSIVNKLFEHEV